MVSMVPLALAPLLDLAAAGSSAPSVPSDPIAQLLLYLSIILVAAKLGGDIATRLGQPAVLGELVAGVTLGNLHLTHLPGTEFFVPIAADPSIDVLARLGVLILLFEVGLVSTVAEMRRVGVSSLLVAALGVVTPFALGWGVALALLPAASWPTQLFLGAVLVATSVGITARVLQDLNRETSDEARVILGAAVIDDVLGLLVLAVVAGSITAADRGSGFSLFQIAILVGKAALFLVGGLVFGQRYAARVFAVAARLHARGVLLAVGLAFCFFFAWASNAAGLSPVVGAFAAGLVLEESHFQDFRPGERSLPAVVAPVSAFLVPIFFVVAGMHTDVAALAQPGVLLLAAALTAAAIAGKQACYAGVVAKGVDRLTVSLGMVPRGEVGLIFASTGLGLSFHGRPVLDAALFSSVVIMVIVTTLLTPPLLKWRLAQLAKREKTRT